MAVKKKSKSKTEKPPAIDKLLKPAIGVVLAFVGYYFMKGLDANVSPCILMFKANTSRLYI